MESGLLRRVCLGLVLLALATTRIEADGEAEGTLDISSEVVITLDHTNFTEIVSKHDFILVEFYAPWCGHCKKLAPEYEKAASELINQDPPITLAKVDVTAEGNRDLALKHDVQGIPTLKILRNGAQIVQNYKGPREADGIVSYINKLLGPPSLEIKSANDIDQTKIFIAGVFPQFSGEEYDNFTKLAKKLQSEYEFGHTLDAKVLPRGDSYVTGPLIRLLKPFDELVADFKNFDLDAVEKFIEEEDAPSVLVNELVPANEDHVSRFSKKSTKVTLLLNFTSENAEALKSKFYDIAVLFKGGNLGFQIGDIEPSKSLFQRFKLDESRAPLIYIQEGDQKSFLANLEPDQLVPWFKKFLDRKVKPCNISLPIPQENNEPVKTVVLDTLQDMVFNSGKEVLLEFFAPWCIHCKNIAPTFDEIAIFYENDTNVMVAKFDATMNDIPSEYFEVRAYPTIMFVSSTGKIVEYDYKRGARVEDFVEFIEENRDDKSKNEDGIKSEALEEQVHQATSLKDEL